MQHGSGGAARLNAQLAGAAPAAPPTLRQAVLSEASPTADAGAPTEGALTAPAGLRQRLGGMVLRVGDMLQPAGEAHGDATWHERTANVLTSLPFLALGWRMHKWVGWAECGTQHSCGCISGDFSSQWWWAHIAGGPDHRKSNVRACGTALQPPKPSDISPSHALPSPRPAGGG